MDGRGKALVPALLQPAFAAAVFAAVLALAGHAAGTAWWTLAQGLPAALVQDLSDEQVFNLHRGGHDEAKIFAAYAAAAASNGKPTVILAKTIKGYALGPSFAGRNATHQMKKLSKDDLKAFRDRLNIPVSDDALDPYLPPYYKPAEDSVEMQYLRERRAALGGWVPRRSVQVPGVPKSVSKSIGEAFDEFKELDLEAPADERWELIGGYIFRMMTGGTAAHNEIVINMSSRLWTTRMPSFPFPASMSRSPCATFMMARSRLISRWRHSATSTGCFRCALSRQARRRWRCRPLRSSSHR